MYRYQLILLLGILNASFVGANVLQDLGPVAFGGGIADTARATKGAKLEFVFLDQHDRLNSISLKSPIKICQTAGLTQAPNRCVETGVSSIWSDTYAKIGAHNLTSPNPSDTRPQLAVFYKKHGARLLTIDLDNLAIIENTEAGMMSTAKSLIHRDLGADTCPQSLETRDLSLEDLNVVNKTLYAIINVTCSAAYRQEYQLLLTYKFNLEIDESASKAFAFGKHEPRTSAESYQNFKGLALGNATDEYVVRTGFARESGAHRFEIRKLSDNSLIRAFELPAKFYSALVSDFHDYSKYFENVERWVIVSKANVAVIGKDPKAELKLFTLPVSMDGYLEISPVEIMFYGSEANDNVGQTTFTKINVDAGEQRTLESPGLIQPRGAMGTGIKTEVATPVLMSGKAFFLMTDVYSPFAEGNIALQSLDLAQFALLHRTPIFASLPETEFHRARLDFFKVGQGSGARLVVSLARHLRAGKFSPRTILLNDDLVPVGEKAAYIEKLFDNGVYTLAATLSPDQDAQFGPLSRSLLQLTEN